MILQADLVFVNTCSIREKAEQTVRKRLEFYQSVKKKKNPKILLLVFWMYGRTIKRKIFEEEKLVDIVVGPDAYRDLPKLIKTVENGKKTGS